MAKQTFQGLLRTFAGRGKSGIDKRAHKPRGLLPMNLYGPIQIVLTAPANGAHEVGMIPAGFAIDKVTVMTKANAGTFALDIPAYDGELTENLVTAGDATGGDAIVLDADRTMIPFDQDVPLIVTTASVTGTLRIGIWGVPFDDATKVD